MRPLLAGVPVLAAAAVLRLAAGTAPLPAQSPPSATGPAFTAVQPEMLGVPNSLSNAWGDYDNDGDLDLAVSLGSGEIRLYRNDLGVLVSVGAQVGMPQAGGQDFRGLSRGDFDGDGFIDLLGGATAKEALTVVLHNEGGKRFTNVAAETGLTIPNRSARQTNWVDYDNDGDLDVYATGRAGDNRTFRNDGGRFTPVFVGVGPTDAKDSPLNRGDHGVQFVDYDNDGALELTLTDGYGAQGGHFVFRNAMPDEAKRRSLSVLVLDAEGHHTRYGAEVRLFDAAGRILASRQVLTGGGYNTQRAAPVHVGLTSIAPVTVEVTFMTRDGRKGQTVRNVSPAEYGGKSLVIRQAK